jgi:hypothetical protein
MLYELVFNLGTKNSSLEQVKKDSRDDLVMRLASRDDYQSHRAYQDFTCDELKESHFCPLTNACKKHKSVLSMTDVTSLRSVKEEGKFYVLLCKNFGFFFCFPLSSSLKP